MTEGALLPKHGFHPTVPPKSGAANVLRRLGGGDCSALYVGSYFSCLHSSSGFADGQALTQQTVSYAA